MISYCVVLLKFLERSKADHIIVNCTTKIVC
jgi:hypothetical protein